MKQILPLLITVLSLQSYADSSCPDSKKELNAYWQRAVETSDARLMKALDRCFDAYSTKSSTSVNIEITDMETIYAPPRKPISTSETYNIDRLKIETDLFSFGCATGSKVIMTLTGMIGPDSSFAMNELLERYSPCRDEAGNLLSQVELNLNSGGGLLKDGYKLGNTLKKYNVRAVIKDGTACASSCAVAFLGAADRVVEDQGQIMFHAPYFSGNNTIFKGPVDCNVGEALLNELKDYYVSMTDNEIGERLYERTMWYCSADDGWVVTGGAAAELYGIATQR